MTDTAKAMREAAAGYHDAEAARIRKAMDDPRCERPHKMADAIADHEMYAEEIRALPLPATAAMPDEEQIARAICNLIERLAHCDTRWPATARIEPDKAVEFARAVLSLFSPTSDGGAVAEGWQVGDQVIKKSGYEFPGEVRAVYTTRKGEPRVVVEMIPYGLQHIFNPGQLAAAPLPHGEG